MSNQQQNNDKLSLDVSFKLMDILRYNMSIAMKNVINIIILLVGVGCLIFFGYKCMTTTERLDICITKNIVFVIIPVLIFISIPGRIWKLTLTQMTQPAFANGVNYVFSNEAIRLDIGEAAEDMNWSLFINIVETKHDFRFYIDTVNAQIIPKHNLSQDELQQLRKIIKDNASDRCHLL